MNEIQQTLFDYIKDYFEIDDDPEFTPDINLFDFGFVDSLDGIVIINFIEEHWSVEITQKDLTLYPMNSINEMAIVVEEKLK